MNKINSIKINGVTRNIENIAYLLALPTASAESPDFVSVNGVLYAKTLTNDIYVYITVQKKLTAGDNISISNTGVISVTGELGTQIEANPELTGDETKLNSITIDGVNYEIGGSNDANKVDLNTPFTSVGEIVIAQDTTSVKGSGVKVSDLATKSDLNNLATKSDLDDLTTTSEVNTAISNSLTGAVSTIKTSNLTASRVLVSDSSGKVAASSNVTTTELGYLDGVTSSIQTQLNTINTNVAARPTQTEVESLIEDFVTFGENPSTYTVEALSGVTYGFTLGSDGYYASTNKSNSTFALCKVVFNLTEAQNIVISCYQSSENGYDFGLLSTLDKTLNADANVDSANVFANHKGLSGNATTTYSNVSAGEHSIYIKYRKDSSQSNGSDVFKFKIEPLTGSANTNIITDGTNTLDLSEVGHGVEIIDITDLDAIPEEYQDIEKLKTCYLRSGSLIYRLSYDGTSDDSGLYYENSDELYYNYLRITSNFNIEGNPDGVGNKQIATQD